MTVGLSTALSIVGTVLASAFVAGTMILLGINPILSVLAASVLALDVLYYHRRRSVDTDAAMQELVSGQATGSQASATRDSRR